MGRRRAAPGDGKAEEAPAPGGGGADAGEAKALAAAAATWSRLEVDDRSAAKVSGGGAGGPGGAEVALSWRSLHYEIAGRRKGDAPKVVLRDISGAALPGQVLAVMGPTGSGKTSLLNALCGRLPAGGHWTGEVLAGGAPRTPAFRSIAAYVMQDEQLVPFLTVRETLELHARLRQPPGVPDADKVATVASLIDELGLRDAAETLCGRPGGFPRGVSGGERRRCSIGVEMVGTPSLLFLDEPTSGLDSFQAKNVVEVMKGLAARGRTVLCTIHQPRSAIYAAFDQLLLLSQGQLLYLGAARDAVDYFASISFRCPTLSNPADFFMDVTSPDARDASRDEASRERISLLAGACAARGLAARALEAAGGADGGKREGGGGGGALEHRGTGAGWLLQFALLLGRVRKCQARDFAGVGFSMAMEVLYALLVAALFRQAGDDQEGVQNRVGCLFFVVLNVAYTSALPAVQIFAFEKDVFLRERTSQAYTTSAYFLSKYIGEVPKLVPRVVFCVILYFIVGLNADAGRFFTFVLIVLLEALSAQAVGVLVTACLPVGAALAVGPVIITIFSLFGGIYLNLKSIPAGAAWIKHVDFVYYAFTALCVNEFEGQDGFECDEGDERCLQDGEAVLEVYSMEDLGVPALLGAQAALGAGVNFLAYLVLERGAAKYAPLNPAQEEEAGGGGGGAHAPAP